MELDQGERLKGWGGGGWGGGEEVVSEAFYPPVLRLSAASLSPLL